MRDIKFDRFNMLSVRLLRRTRPRPPVLSTPSIIIIFLFLCCPRHPCFRVCRWPTHDDLPAHAFRLLVHTIVTANFFSKFVHTSNLKKLKLFSITLYNLNFFSIFYTINFLKKFFFLFSG